MLSGRGRHLLQEVALEVDEVVALHDVGAALAAEHPRKQGLHGRWALPGAHHGVGYLQGQRANILDHSPCSTRTPGQDRLSISPASSPGGQRSVTVSQAQSPSVFIQQFVTPTYPSISGPESRSRHFFEDPHLERASPDPTYPRGLVWDPSRMEKLTFQFKKLILFITPEQQIF